MRAYFQRPPSHRKRLRIVMGSKRSNKRGRCDDSGSSAGLESPTAVQRRHARHAGKEVTDGGGPTSPHSPPAKGQRSGGATDDGVAFPRLSSLIDPLVGSSSALRACVADSSPSALRLPATRPGRTAQRRGPSTPSAL